MEESDDVSKQVSRIEDLLEECGSDIEAVKKLHLVILDSVSYEQRIELEKNLADLMSKIKLKVGFIRDELEGLETDKKEGQVENGTLLDSPTNDLIFQKKKASLANSFVQLIHTYRAEKVKFRDECTLRLKQHLTSGDLTFTEQEIDGMLEDGDFSAFVQNYSAASDHQKKTLQDIQARHERIKSLNNTIEEIRKLIENVQVVVRHKGIEIANAADDTNLANELTSATDTKVGRADRWSTEATRKRWYLILFGIFVAVVIAIVISASLSTPYPELPKPMPVS